MENLEKVLVSRGERIVLQMLEKKYRWIARDKTCNYLYVYEKKPVKDRERECWHGCDPLNLIAFNHHFQFIKWEDDEPWLIKDIINKCGVKFD